VTVDDVTYQRRVRVFELAQELGNVSAACRAVDVSRNSYFQLLARITARSTSTPAPALPGVDLANLTAGSPSRAPGNAQPPTLVVAGSPRLPG
jgi:hypothetical protein